jgi:hypothetical protein
MTPEDKHELRLMIREEVTSVVAKLVDSHLAPKIKRRVNKEILLI